MSLRRLNHPGAALAAALVIAAVSALAPAAALAWEPTVLIHDPLVHMPGTQPDPLNSIAPASACLNCHSGYNPAIEPGFLWRGSMMGQSARDPLFWAGLTVAAQDSIWQTGNANAADLCERCHMPKGWLELRSDPPNALAMSGADYDGVQCDFCHRMVDPFFEDTWLGAREGADWSGYWDEMGLSAMASQASADLTHTADVEMSSSVLMFNGNAFYDASHRPASAAYTESSNGQYFIAPGMEKRGPFADATALHPMLYSRFHKSKHYCTTCHDVSNTLVANEPAKGTQPLDGVTVLPTEELAGHAYGHVERTSSEFMLSDFGLPGGSPGTGPFAPAGFKTSRPGNAIATCQDCHMADTSGAGCKLFGAIDRPTGSVEHPGSGQPVHDLTGGNAFIPFVLASTVPSSPNYDAVNASLLGQGAAALTLDLNYGLGLDAVALLAGGNRALAQLTRAATIENVSYNAATGALSFRIQNHTGHKLISGYPEGRRMFVNVRLSSGAALVHEVNPYDATVGTLKGLSAAYSPSSPALSQAESYADDLVYEAHMQSAWTGEEKTFHFILSTGRAKDNRIPPKGFRIAEAPARMAEPVALGVSAPGLFSAAEYAGGYDDVSITLPPGGRAVEVNLYYQTTSREYVEFLRDEIKGTGKTLSSPTPSGEPMAYIAQADPFFSNLKKWGETIWQLWEHNKDVPGAAPVLMAKAKVVVGDVCSDAGAQDGDACDDGDACTTADACAAGVCKGGPAPACDDGNPCTDDACDAVLGCMKTPNAAACDDGSACSAGDVCAFGLCVGAAIPCDDEDACTADSCDGALGCVHEPVADCPPPTSSSSTSSSSAAGTGGAGGAGGAGVGGQGGVGGEGGAGGPTPPPRDEGGCDCSAPGTSRGTGGLSGALAALALGLTAAARSRRRR
jgi:hypothetical protein